VQLLLEFRRTGNWTEAIKATDVIPKRYTANKSE